MLKTLKTPYDGTYTQTVEITAVDIPTMAAMGESAYRSYLEANELFWIDHHDVLRAVHGEYPIAVTPPQLDVLIEYLQGMRSRFATGDHAPT